MEPTARDRMMVDVLDATPSRSPTSRLDANDRRVPRARRRGRTLAIHVGLYVMVNAFMVGTWVMTRLAPGQPGHRRPPKGFWPGWMIVTWEFLLGLHYLYVRARRQA